MKKFIVLLSVSLLLLTSCLNTNHTTISDQYRNYYEIFVRSFYDSNSDGIGDLAGVTQKLDYISKNLGADGIWLMPIFPSPSYHKYDVSDYYNIDPQYGTLSDFDTLVREAHSQDIKIILDLVINHTSNQNPWFDNAVKALWKGGENDYTDYYNFTTEDKGEGFAKITDKYFYECRFVSDMPDLNLDNQKVKDEIGKIVRFWLDRGVDGFRLDAVTSYFTGETSKNIEFLRWFNEMVKAYKADSYLIGEAWTTAPVILEYYQSGIDSFFNFPYSQPTGALAATINQLTGNTFSMELAAWNKNIRTANASAIDSLFLSNHDMARSAGFLMRNLQKEKMAAALYLLAPGNPFIYYGEELGMTGSGVDPNKRLPMVWSNTDPSGIPFAPPGSSQTVLNVAGAEEQIKDEFSLLNYYKSILKMKKSHPEIARGIMESFDSGNENGILFSVTFKDQTVYVIHNISSEPLKLTLPSSIKTKLTVSAIISAIEEAEKPKLSGNTITLPPLSSTILK